MLEELQRRNFAPTTISTYLHAVEQFARHFKCRPDRLNQTHFRSYQAYLLRERKMRPLTVRLHVAAWRFFFVKTLKRRYLLDDTPYPKAPRRLPQILSVEEVARLIDAADSLSHRTMLMVLYSTGMRNAELRHLQVACGIAALLTTGCTSIAGLVVLHVAFDEDSQSAHSWAVDPDHPAACRLAATTVWIDLLYQQGGQRRRHEEGLRALARDHARRYCDLGAESRKSELLCGGLDNRKP